tara:strand:- start:642 stop:872 length:231 start_codon:yes stop_codon:yes gene_type:complete
MKVASKDPALDAFLKSFLKPKLTAPKWLKAEKEANRELVERISKSQAIDDFNASLSPQDRRDEEIWNTWERILSAE